VAEFSDHKRRLMLAEFSDHKRRVMLAEFSDHKRRVMSILSNSNMQPNVQTIRVAVTILGIFLDVSMILGFLQ
jgi:hypothetical protein